MKIYLSHSTNMNYQKLYESVKKIENVRFVLPHSGKAIKSKNVIKKCSLMIADVSKPSHGVGIEIGWADSFHVPVILICKKGSKVSSSLKIISKRLVEYKNFDDAAVKIQNEIRRIKNGK